MGRAALRPGCRALAYATAFLVACGGGGGGGAPDAPVEDPTGDGSVNGFSRRLLLEHLATQFLIPTYEQFAVAAHALPPAIDAYCAAPSADTRAAAQAAWRGAIDVWQKADAVLVGPAAMDASAISSRIYSWPLISACAVDTDTASRHANPASYDIEARFDNARSLSTVEYLLFAPITSAHNCPSAPAGWSAVLLQLEKARCELAAIVARDVAAQADLLVTRWKPEGGNYLRELVEAGTAQSSIASAQEAVNMVSDSLFFVDKMTKDMKLAEAAGIAANSCGTIGQRCDAEVEHLLSDHGQPAIVLNLRALRAAFTGQVGDRNGPAFDDFLIEVGAESLAAQMVSKLDAAITAAEAIPASYDAALTSNRDSVVAAHAALKAFTDDLKSQFLTVLGLDIPDDVAGDND